MDRRRSGAKTRPPTSEELTCWNQTLASVNEFTRIQGQTPSTDKVNKWFNTLPQDEILQADGFESLKAVKGKLTAGLSEIKTSADAEAKALNDALESLRVLIALRKGPDGDKRKPRIRLSSPSSLPGSPRTASYPTLSSGPLGGNRDPRARREWVMNQLPLQPGRKVAFRQPPQGKRAGEPGAGDSESETWILAAVKRCIGNDIKKYEVQDEDNDDGEPGQEYKTTIKNLIPLPIPDAPPNSMMHPNAYEEFPTGSEVLGLYPDTSCFYKAVVAAGPRDPAPGSNRPGNGKYYHLKFEDDDDQVRAVKVEWVVAP